ncbi:MAG: dihydrofolate reductase family protein [Ginsengibacter sp.]
MRKVILLMHTSLDGFVAGPNGEMDWIIFDEELADDVGKITGSADTALYGRITYQMMESYWPTAADSPTATKHDIEHAEWANNALKIVFSRSLEKTGWKNTKIVRDNIVEEISNMKTQPGKNLLLIGSAGIAHTFMEHNLIDEYRINVNPVILGAGIPLSKNINNKINLKLVQSKTFDCGVVAVHYEVQR